MGSMPRWGTCHAEEHATLGSMLTGHHGSHILLTHCKCAAAFHHAANTPQLHLRNASALTRNRFFYTTHADFGLFISPVRLFRTIHSSKDLRSTSIRPHTYLLNGSSHILAPIAPDHKPHPTITRIQTPIVSDHYCIGSTVAHHGPSHKLCSRRICKQRSMAGYGILHARTGFKLSEDGAFPEDGRIVKVFPPYNQPLPPQR